MIHAFVGKGGVGKTTVSSAVALNASRKYRTALVSTDFMSSLRVLFPEDRDNLTVIELSESEVAEKWKKRYGKEVLSVLSEFVDVEDWILDHIAGSPGVAEEFMMANIVEIDESGKYDLVIWDTAASSSTMHLLLLQREFYEHLDRDVRIFMKLKDRLRFKGASKILEQWKQLASSVWASLSKSKFYLVSTQDELSVLQADDIENDFKSMGLKMEGRIYNRCRREVEVRDPVLAAFPEYEGSAIHIVNEIVEAQGLDFIMK